MPFASIIVILLIGINSIWDVRRHEILLIPTVLIGLAGVVYSVKSGTTWTMMAASLIPGVFMVVLSFLFKRQIGTGDGIVILALGAWKDAVFVFGILFWAFLTAAALSAIYLAKENNNKEIPFIPFLLIGCVIYIILTFAGE